ncbi:MAG: B12-binding domain-containing radical SAM protein [Planctomycetota bacterium]|jgi:radical SAM superfamily enzyme YgiQ (UPF0313 family)
MELWHNQVTRVQGPFSLRMFHRSWGLMLMQANMDAPCTCLDFPSLDRFIEEIRDNHYDVVGISGIMPNIGKVRKMCRLIREHLPEATIVIGGHITGCADLGERIDADHIVRGDGVRWFRRFLGEDENQPIRHPMIYAGFQRRTMGVAIPFSPRNMAAALITSVGCPVGCNFCSTSAMFGGKGRFVNFYETGEELFDVMCRLEEGLEINSFFVMDENFLLHRRRALRLLELMRARGKSWSLNVFSSANALKSYTMEELVGLGVSWVWLGLEGKDSRYGKLSGTDTRELVRALQENGIRVLGSSIIGLEEHTPENIDEAIDYAVSHEADFHQFMLYTPVPGTPLYAELDAAGKLLSNRELPDADNHGQYRFSHRHPHIRPGEETEMLLRAFGRDFEVNGPSVLRVVGTALAGWRKYRDHPERRIRQRFAWEVEAITTLFAGGLWAARKWFRDNPDLRAKTDAMLRDIHREFGIRSRLSAGLYGRIIYRLLRREDRRLQAGWTCEPPTFYETNYHQPHRPDGSGESPGLLRWVAASLMPLSV